MSKPPRSALELVVEARELLQTTVELLSEIESVAPTAPLNRQAGPVDFDALPGRSPYARADALYAGRRIRDRLFAPGLFGEPAWDILLALFLAGRAGGALSLEAVYAASEAPPITADRYITFLEGEGLVERSDGSMVRLTSLGLGSMTTFFERTDGQLSESRSQMPRLCVVDGPDPLPS